MDYSEKLLDHRVQEAELKRYGFIAKGPDFVLVRLSKADPSFSFKITLCADSFKVDLIDSATLETYVPFSVEGIHGSFVASFREEADALVEEILSHCFTSDSLREKLLQYAKDRYDAEIAYPWPQQFPRYCTIKEKNNPKWFGLIMNVPYAKLGLNKKGVAEILNVKLDPNEIQSLIDRKTYLPAYHMSKKDWISVLLSLETPFEDVTKLLEESHALCLGKKK